MAEHRHSFAYLFERFPSFVQTFVYREAEEMVRRGARPLLVSIREPEDPPEVRHRTGAPVLYLPGEKAVRAEVETQRSLFTHSQRRYLSKWRALPDSGRVFEALWLGYKLRAQKIHHVHAHFGGMAARTAWHMQKLWGIRYSFTGHANDIFCDTEFPVSNTMLAASARFIVTETDYARRWMEERYPNIRGRVFRVFNGLAMEGFPAHSEEQGSPRVVSVGRLVEKKGFPDLVHACALLRDRGVEFSCEIIGEGPLEEKLLAQIRDNKLELHVKMVGPKSQAEVLQTLASSRLFALACRSEGDGGSDNLPTVIMEAMACGTPVVSTRLAGIPEMIDEGQTGMLVESGAVPALADAMQQFLTNSSMARKAGETAREIAHQRFAINRSALLLMELLASKAAVSFSRRLRRAHPQLKLSIWKRIFRF